MQLHLGECASPLTYVCRGRHPEPFDPSLIELGLPVDAHAAERAAPLPYWPSYRQASPAQRATHQRWMIGGRRDPATPLGYVFIFFYGLERRVLVDGRDHTPIARELLRLLSIYGEQSHSFRRYGTSLLWHVIRRAMDEPSILKRVLREAHRVAGRWTDEALTLCLSVYHDLERPVPADLALQIAERDQRTSNSVIVRRHRQEFEMLFLKRYRERFGDGLVLKSSKRPTVVRHQAASAFLGRDAAAQLHVEVPNCLAITSQFKPLVQMWDACVEELRGYDRAVRQSGDEAMTAEMYEQMPEDLRTGDHPEFDDWWRVKTEHTDDTGRSLVPIAELAAVKGFEHRPKLTLSQSRKLVASADAMGFAIEPDVRITNRPYRWDEKVCLFIAEADQTPSNRYLPAATLLRLGMVVAESSGVIEQDELDKITEHLEQQLELSDAESERLEQLEHLLLREGARYELLTKGLIESLSKAQRSAVGAYLVGVAAASGVITDAEYKAVKKLYRRLGLEPEALDELLAEVGPESDEPVEVQPAAAGPAGERIPPPRGITLDRDRLEDVQRQTSEVARILGEAMRTEVDEQDDADPQDAAFSAAAGSPGTSTEAPGGTIRFRPSPAQTDARTAASSANPPDMASGQIGTRSDEPAAPQRQDDEAPLPDRLRRFLDAVVERDSWSRQELRTIADTHGLMLDGAIDEVNEWAEARYGDRLIEEDGPALRVELALLEDEA